MTDEIRTIDQMLAWRDGVRESLARDRAIVTRAISAGELPSPRFIGMTEREVGEHFSDLRLETDRFVVLGLVAAGEASIRLDYERRLRIRGKGILSRAYRVFHKGLKLFQRQRTPFDEGGILDELKGSGVIDNQIVGRFRECLPARHWVAHGRYFERPDAVDRLPPEVVYVRVRELIDALNALPL